MSWADDTDGKARTEYVDREIDDAALDDLANVMEIFGLRERAMRSAGCRAEDFALVPTYVPTMTDALVSIVAAQEICDRYTVPDVYRGEAAAMAEVDKRRGESRQAARAQR